MRIRYVQIKHSLRSRITLRLVMIDASASILPEWQPYAEVSRLRKHHLVRLDATPSSDAFYVSRSRSAFVDVFRSQT